MIYCVAMVKKKWYGGLYERFKSMANGIMPLGLLGTGIILAVACTSRAADFRVTGEVLSKDFVGFGANISPLVYCAPNWPDEINEGNVQEFEKRVMELKPQHVRIFIKPEWWDSDKIKEKQKGRSVERVCQLMQRVGASVNLTLWGGVHRAGKEMGRRTADVVGHLLKDEQVKCIQYATLQNEPNGFNMDKGTYVDLYRAFDAELRRLGVRDRIKIIGGDLLSTRQEEWLKMLAKDLPDVLDGYSIHMYSDYWDSRHMAERLSAIPPILATLPAEGKKPLYLMEFGVRGHREVKKNEPGRDERGLPLYWNPLAGTLLAYHMIEAINEGYVALCQWDLADILYDRNYMQYGLIGEGKDGFPVKPCYFLMKLFTHSAGPGWETIKVDGQAEMRSVAAMRSKQGDWAIFAVNRSSTAMPLSVSGLKQGEYHVRIWNAEGEGLSEDRGTNTVGAEGLTTISLPGLSVVALTTRSEE